MACQTVPATNKIIITIIIIIMHSDIVYQVEAETRGAEPLLVYQWCPGKASPTSDPQEARAPGDRAFQVGGIAGEEQAGELAAVGWEPGTAAGGQVGGEEGEVRKVR